LQLKPGDPFQPDRVRLDESELATRIAPHGYPHVRVEAHVDQDDEKSRAHITYRISTGPYVQVGTIVFAGNFRTRDSILARELEFGSDDPFSLAEVLAAQRNLRSTGLFETVQVRTIGLKEMEPVVHLLFLTVEKKPYFFELGGGYDTSKGLYARTKTGDHNFLGTDKDLWAGGEIAETGWRWDAGISNPRLFGSRVQADMGGYIERQENFNQDFGVDSAGSTISLSRRWPWSVTTYLAWRYERRQQFLREQDASQDVDPRALDPRSNLVTTPSLIYDSRDSFIRPHNGWLANLSLDLSNGLDNDLDDFIRYKADLRAYHPLRPDLTLAGMVRMGYIVALGDNAAVPEDQLFFLGGTLDVRGYKENLLQFDAEGDPVGGRLALSASVEARYDIGYHLELAAFIDAGRLQLTLDDAQEDEWRWTTGLGLRYQTPIGPIGLLYGHKVDPRPGESRGQFHFTIGYTF
jgi:outer membrane protein insertion porin family